MQPSLYSISTLCPGCGAAALLPAGEGGRRSVCERCGRCWEDVGPEAREVDTLACPGCARRTVCESRPSWLADSMASVKALRDGTRVLIRPLLYSDREELALRYGQLSPESRRLRFFLPPSELTSRELDYLTNLDYENHFAWAAFAIDDPGRPGIAVARYVREDGDPRRAEAAVTVLDAYQRRGLGTLLLILLAETASDNGVLTFVLHVLWENVGVVDPLRELGARIEAEEPGVARIEVDLPAAAPTPSEGLVRRLLATIAAVLHVPGEHPASSSH